MKKIFKKYDKIITLEDHSKIGGIASIVNELQTNMNLVER